MSSLAVGYVFSDRLKEEANAAGRNYWYAYVEEILSRLGVCAERMDVDACAQPRALSRYGVLVLGDFEASVLAERAQRALTDWVAAGGVLIAFATEGLDELFGIVGGEKVPQPDGPFSISGYLELTPSAVTEDCRAPIEPQQKLIIVSPIRLVRAPGCEELARLLLCDSDRPRDGKLTRDAHLPAITWRVLGGGHAFYCAFNVAQTMWAIQQGRPIDRDYDGDGYLRASDACVIGDNSRAVPYTDALHFLLANMIGRRSVPMVHAVPPREGKVAPALLYFGGDDECSQGIHVPASDFMAARGLPYHMNIMPVKGKFAIGKEEQAHIEANGHEIALHYNFMDGFDHPTGFTREDVLEQARLFREAFGRDSVCTVCHWCRWTGWAEPARWMLEAGGHADNCRVHWTSPPINPINLMGFAFGSSLPRYFWDDAAHGNARVDFLELPMTAYEYGYEGENCYPEKVKEALALATRYHLTLNFFFHPVYVAKYPGCQKAIDEMVRLMAEMPVPPVLMGPDAVCRWWQARSQATIKKAGHDGGRVLFEAQCDWKDGFVVKVATGNAPARACRIDGKGATLETAHEFGQHWAFVPLAPGRHKVELTLSA